MKAFHISILTPSLTDVFALFRFLAIFAFEIFGRIYTVEGDDSDRRHKRYGILPLRWYFAFSFPGDLRI